MEATRLSAFILCLVVALIGLTACSPPSPSSTSQILLFNGTGTSPNDVKAIEVVLKESHLDYSTVNSWQLNRMSESQLTAWRLIIIPGGNYIRIGEGLTTNTRATIHDAVKEGLNYLGICAGGLLAGDSPGKSLNLTSGVRFGFYVVVNRGIHKTAVKVSGAGSPPLEQYWEDGPQFSGWGEVVGKYPDGTPAVVQGTSGKG